MPKRKGDRKHRKLKAVAAGVLFEALAMKARGYPLGGRIVVRCREGHLFTTLWIPGASVKSFIDCQRIAGSESSNHCTTERVGICWRSFPW